MRTQAQASRPIVRPFITWIQGGITVGVLALFFLLALVVDDGRMALCLTLVLGGGVAILFMVFVAPHLVNKKNNLYLTDFILSGATSAAAIYYTAVATDPSRFHFTTELIWFILLIVIIAAYVFIHRKNWSMKTIIPSYGIQFVVMFTPMLLTSL